MSITSTGSHVHTGGRQGCDLAPGCQLSWNRSTRISKVAVLGGNHPKVGQEVWSCHHHSLASVKGYRLQMQMVKHKPRSDTKNKDGEVVMVNENLDAQVKVKSSRSSKRNVRAYQKIWSKSKHLQLIMKQELPMFTKCL